MRTQTIEWIERLLNSGTYANRGFAINWILAPFLLGPTKGMSYNQAFAQLQNFMLVSSKLKPFLNDNQTHKMFYGTINHALNWSRKARQPPMTLSKLYIKNPQLYNELKERKIITAFRITKRLTGIYDIDSEKALA